jgi:hypothetical protein
MEGRMFDDIKKYFLKIKNKNNERCQKKNIMNARKVNVLKNKNKLS